MERVGMSPAFHATSVPFCMLIFYLFGGFVGGDNFRKKHLPSPSRARSSCVCPTRSTSRSIKPASLPPHTHSAFYRGFYREDRPKCGKRAINGGGISMNKNMFRFPCSFLLSRKLALQGRKWSPGNVPMSLSHYKRIYFMYF